MFVRFFSIFMTRCAKCMYVHKDILPEHIGLCRSTASASGSDEGTTSFGTPSTSGLDEGMTENGGK